MHECRCEGEQHATFGACMRAKNLRVGYCGQGGGDATRQKHWDRELDAYRDARRQGIQPEGTTMRKIRRALDASDHNGTPYNARDPLGLRP